MSEVATPPAPFAPAAPTPTPAAAPAPSSAAQPAWYQEFLQQDGSLNAKALDRLPDHLKPLKSTWEKAKTIEELGVIHLNSQHLNGKKALAPLPPDAPDAVKTERKALLDGINGVPATPKEYGITRPQDLPEQFWSQPAADNLAKWAHDNSVSPAAAQKLMQEHAKIIKADVANHEQYVADYQKGQQQTFEAQIRQENISGEKASALIEKGAIALGLDPASPETQKLFKDSAQVRLMAMRHAIAIGEDHAVTSNSQGTGQGDPEAAAKDIQRNPANPLYAAYWNKGGALGRAAQEAAVERVNGLLRQAEAMKAGAKR